MIKHLFEEYAYSEKCDIAGAVAQITAAGLGVLSTELTNESNEKIAKQTNQANTENVKATNESNERMNAENNALQQSLADQAYQRSTASNQIAELIAAGYSPAQAKQIVAGSGAAPSMPMPGTTASVDTAPQDSSYQNAAPDLSGLSAAATAISGDLDRADGGALGQWLYNDAANIIHSIPGYDPTQFNTFAEFASYCQETIDDPNAPGGKSYAHPEFLKAYKSKEVQRMARSFLGVRAFNNDHGTFIDNKNKTIAIARSTVQLDRDKIGLMMDSLDVEDRELLRPLQNELALKKFQNELETFELRKENNKEYLQKSLKNLLSSEENQRIVLASQNIKYKASYEALRTRPEFADMLAIYELFDQCGITKTEIGAALAALEANGVQVLPALKKLVEFGSQKVEESKGLVEKWSQTDPRDPALINGTFYPNVLGINYGQKIDPIS